ncbi:ABC transporter substrate-binding protein [Gluconacetobacter diazotrophicus]|uniref:ABC transporter substrate-binding protein n=1 Tax=Gluconacetobacter diazotrophicus TaxID=33996 RepID=UPI00031DE71F|nr:ABC transporter substrate-binding protein [Gluconacetobacter diazotrophicus]
MAFRSHTRRDALQILAGGAIAACAPPGARAQAVEIPRRGGRIRVAGFSGSSADTLDPARGALSTDYIRGAMFYDALTELDEALQVQPSLAIAIESDDAIRWTIRLRKGVRFHDGSPLTADDVVFSLLRHLDPRVGSQQKAIARQFGSIRARAADEVELTLVAANVDLPALLSLAPFYIIKNATTDFSRANGTGPFLCQEFSPGIRSVAVRNPDYWRDGQPHLDEIEFFTIADDMARHDALMSGDVDLIGGVNPRLAPLLRQRGLQIMEAPGGAYTDFIMRLDQAPGNNPDFVRGMKYLFNREQMKSAIFRGYAQVGNDQPIAPGFPYFDASLPQTVQDLDRARYHFRRSGLTGSRVPMVCSPAAEGSVEMAILLQHDAPPLGIDLAIQQVPADGYWSNYWMQAPISFGNLNPRPRAEMAFSLSYASDAPWNESRWRNPEFDRLLRAARGERNESLRAEMFAQMQVLVHDGSGVCIPLFLSDIDAFSPRLRGMRPRKTGEFMGFEFARHVWLAS